VRVSAKVDYAVRAMCELAAHDGADLCKAEAIARAQDIPLSFLENILLDLRRAGLVGSRRGQVGGYWLARSPSEISVADVVRAVEGPLADVRGERPERLVYHGAAEPLREVWLAVRVSLRRGLETVTLLDIVAAHPPAIVSELLADPDALQPH
jgi:Rrf2 family protein